MFDQYPDIMSVYNVADELHISRNRVYKLLQAGELHGHQEGHVWKVPKIALISYVMERSNTPQKAFSAYT